MKSVPEKASLGQVIPLVQLVGRKRKFDNTLKSQPGSASQQTAGWVLSSDKKLQPWVWREIRYYRSLVLTTVQSFVLGRDCSQMLLHTQRGRIVGHGKLMLSPDYPSPATAQRAVQGVVLRAML